MINMRMGAALALTVFVGLAIGLLIGLAIGWLVWPVQVADVDIGDLKDSAQDDYIVLVASAYAQDRDLDKAESRLEQLQAPNVNERVGMLAKMLVPQNQTQAALVAALALDLGVEDDAVVRIAATPTPTVTPTLIATVPPTAPPATSAIVAPTTTITPTQTATRPRATATRKPPTAAPVAGTEWLPSYPSEWPGGVKFQPANVAPGQQYWHLTKALYCDDRDERNNCRNLPGGDVGTNIYVMLRAAGGARTSAPLIVTKPDGSTAGVDDLGPEKSADDMCSCNYSFLSTSWPIKVAGAPSDTISGMGLYSVRLGHSQAHTRYFLWFQLITR